MSILDLVGEQTLVQAAEYFLHDFTPIPAKLGTKHPLIRWLRYSRTMERPAMRTLGQWYPSGEDRNIALLGGWPSGGLLFLDADNPRCKQETEAHLGGLGLSTTMHERPPTGSDHDGGAAFWLKTSPAAASAKRGALDVKAQGGLAFVPYSLHPDGVRYRFTSWVEDLPHVDLRDLAPLVSLTPAPEPWPALSNYAWRLLENYTAELAGFHSRSELEQALANSLAAAGCSWQQALDIFNDPVLLPENSKYKAKRTHQGTLEAERYLMLTWDKALTFTKQPNKAQAIARGVRVWALGHPWPGRTGPTDKAVLLAHCEISETCAKAEYHASCRTLAELAGIGFKTAAKATNRLIDAQAPLYRAAPRDRGNATRYRLKEPKVCTDDTFSHMSCGIENVSLMHIPGAGHDLWRSRQTGKAGWDVWQALVSVERASVAELVRLTGRCRRTVYHKLAMFAEHGMAEQVGRGEWTVRLDADLDAVAERLGLAGKGEEQRKQHAEQRLINMVYLRTGYRARPTLTPRERAHKIRKRRRKVRIDDNDLAGGRNGAALGPGDGG